MMKQRIKTLILLLTITLIICGTATLFSRTVKPISYEFIISYGTDGGYFIRTETGIITGDYLGQYIAFNTFKQFVDVYIDDVLLLSSKENGYKTPHRARYGLEITPEFIGKELRIVFTANENRYNEIMGERLSFERLNSRLLLVDYGIVGICFVFFIAVMLLAVVSGKRNSGNANLITFAALNILFAAHIMTGTSTSFLHFYPFNLYYLCYLIFYVYTLPMICFFYLAFTGIYKKFAFVSIVINISYTIFSLILDVTHIMPFMQAENGYNIIMAIILISLSVIFALQTLSENRFSILARVHLVAWTVWTVSVVIRFLSDRSVNVNVEYHIMYALVLMSLTFYGIIIYAERIKEMQKREYAMNIKAESLIKNYEQGRVHIHEIGEFKHEMKNHLAAMQTFLKDNRFDEAKDYLAKYVGQVGEITEAAHHENYIINAIISDLLRRAKKIGADVKLNLQASPRNISEPNIYSLLMNIVDNAIEACANVPEEKDRYIILDLKRKGAYFNVICENSKAVDIIELEGEIKTSKTSDGHGYGLGIIKNIINSYDGLMDISYDVDKFIIIAAIKDKKASPSG